MWRAISKTFYAVIHFRPQFRLRTLLFVPVLFSLGATWWRWPVGKTIEIHAGICGSGWACSPSATRLSSLWEWLPAGYRHEISDAELWNEIERYFPEQHQHVYLFGLRATSPCRANFVAYRQLDGYWKLHGPCRVISEEWGVIIETEWRDGIPHGDWHFLNIKSRRLDYGGKFINGRKDGEWFNTGSLAVYGDEVAVPDTRELYRDGKVIKRSWSTDQNVITEEPTDLGWHRREFDLNGSLLSELKNLPEGESPEVVRCCENKTTHHGWYASGKPKFAAQFGATKDHPQAIWSFQEWDEAGRLTFTVLFDGNLIALMDGTTIDRVQSHPHFWQTAKTEKQQNYVRQILSRASRCSLEPIEDKSLKLSKLSLPILSTCRWKGFDRSHLTVSSLNVLMPCEVFTAVIAHQRGAFVERFGSLFLTSREDRDQTPGDRTGVSKLASDDSTCKAWLDKVLPIDEILYLPLRDAVDHIRTRHSIPVTFEYSCEPYESFSVSIFGGQMTLRSFLGILCEQAGLQVQARGDGLVFVPQASHAQASLPMDASP